MNLTTEKLTRILKGVLIKNKTLKINYISDIYNIKEQSLYFILNKKHKNKIQKIKNSTIIVDDKDLSELNKKNNYIVVENIYDSLITILEYTSKKDNKKGVAKSCKIHSSASIHKNIYIGENTSIGSKSKIDSKVQIKENCIIGENVQIGENCKIYPGVVIYDDTQIGENCIIHSGAIIGSDGFGFLPNKNKYKKIPQNGNVVIDNNVEIGANTTIDRGTIGSTKISEGVKLDNLIHIAHNVIIGKNTVIAAQTGIAGSTKIGENCMIGGQVGIVGHIEIADNVKIAAQSGISKSIFKKGLIVQGSPAFEMKKYNKAYVNFKNNSN